MRIAILTCHRAHNCGAMLQAWALKTVIEQMGHTVEFPSCNDVGHVSRFYIQDIPENKHGLQWCRSLCGRAFLDLKAMGCRTPSTNLYNMFRKKYLPERRCLAQEFDKYYDLVVVGSDQVWNNRLMSQYIPLFLGETLPSSIKRISYAASCGDDIYSGEAWNRLIAALSMFDAVSVREEYLRSCIAASLKRPIVKTLDPTLLLNANDYSLFISRPILDVPYLYAYVLSGTEYEIGLARALAKKLGVHLIVTPVYFDAKRHNASDIVGRLSPSIMLNYIAHAKYVIASSFHGTVFALLFGKQFLSLRNQVDIATSRQAELLLEAESLTRLVNPSVGFEECLKRLLAPFKKCVMERLSLSAMLSREWLNSAIGQEGRE